MAEHTSVEKSPAIPNYESVWYELHAGEKTYYYSTYEEYIRGMRKAFSKSFFIADCQRARIIKRRALELYDVSLPPADEIIVNGEEIKAIFCRMSEGKNISSLPKANVPSDYSNVVSRVVKDFVVEQRYQVTWEEVFLLNEAGKAAY